jgi:2,3-bisphosphoglycerate-dependent phosphoglycerate mutase
MEPTTILLARHGETDWNAVGRWQGHTDRALTERGRRQAVELADRLANDEIDAVYSSDLLRAVETAEPVAKRLGLPLQTLPELREVDVGTWAGLTRDEVAKRFPDGFRRWSEWQTGWEDGETYDEMGERVVGAILRLAGEHPGERILVVSHGGAIRALHAAAAGIDIATFRQLRQVVENARVTSILVENGRLSEGPVEDLD